MTLKDMRVINGIMSKFVAKQLGISLRTYQRIEKGQYKRRKFTEKDYEILAYCFRMSVEEVKNNLDY